MPNRFTAAVDRFSAIVGTVPQLPDPAAMLGTSREGRPILGARIGRGATRVSLIGGCHAD